MHLSLYPTIFSTTLLYKVLLSIDLNIKSKSDLLDLIHNKFFHYYNHGWNSFATGQYVQTLSPQTFGERDPIAEERFKVLRTGSEEEKEKMRKNTRREKKNNYTEGKCTFCATDFRLPIFRFMVGGLPRTVNPEP